MNQNRIVLTLEKKNKTLSLVIQMAKLSLLNMSSVFEASSIDFCPFLL